MVLQKHGIDWQANKKSNPFNPYKIINPIFAIENVGYEKLDAFNDDVCDDVLPHGFGGCSMFYLY